MLPVAVIALPLLSAAAGPRAQEAPPVGREHRAEPEADPTTLEALQPTLLERNPLTRAALALQEQMAALGIDPELSWVGDLSVVAGGAEDGGTAARWLLDVGAGLDTERWLGIGSSMVFVNFQVQKGESIVEEVGAAEEVSNIDSEDHVQLDKVWFEHRLEAGGLHYKIGKSDANTDFAWSLHGGRFLHPSFGFTPTIHGMVTFPDPAFGGHVEGFLADGLVARAGVYDGASARGIATGERGPSTLWSGDVRLFTIGELEYSLDAARGDRVVVGAHYHDGTFADPAGRTDRGAAGLYAVLDHTLWSGAAEDERAWSAFAQLGRSLAEVGPFEKYLGAGLVCTAPFATRPHDAAGLACNWVDLAAGAGSPLAGGSELVLELFYTVQATRLLRLKPDVQWLPEPAGANGDAAWVFTLRGIFSF